MGCRLWCGKIALRAITVRAAVRKSRRSPQRRPTFGVTPVRADAQIRLRRSVGLLVVATLLAIDVFATGFFGGNERTLAVVRSIVLPGCRFEWNWLYGIAAIITALSAMGAWLRWGIDWLPALVTTVCVGIAALVMPLHHHHASDEGTPHHVHDGAAAHRRGPRVARKPNSAIDRASGRPQKQPRVHRRAGRVALLARLRLLFDRLPGSAWIKRKLPQGLFFPAVDIARTAAIALFADSDSHTVSNALMDPRLARASAESINGRAFDSAVIRIGVHMRRYERHSPWPNCSIASNSRSFASMRVLGSAVCRRANRRGFGCWMACSRPSHCSRWGKPSVLNDGDRPCDRASRCPTDVGQRHCTRRRC